jgi:hypothetical protein
MAITLPTAVGNTGTNDWSDVYNNDAQLVTEIDDRDDAYKTVFQISGGVYDQINGAGHWCHTTCGIATGAGVSVNPATAGAGSVQIFNLRSADFSVGSKTTKLRVVATYSSNATALVATVTPGLYPVTVAGGSDVVVVTLGTVTSGSTTAITNPSASTAAEYVGSDFTFPSNGAYTLGFQTSAAVTSNHAGFLTMLLQVRHV